jgi:hypothetical protein
MSKVQKHSLRTSYHVSSTSQCKALDDASRLPGAYSDYVAQRLAISRLLGHGDEPVPPRHSVNYEDLSLYPCPYSSECVKGGFSEVRVALNRRWLPKRAHQAC